MVIFLSFVPFHNLMVHNLMLKILFKCGFWFCRIIFFFFGAWLFNVEVNFLSDSSYDLLHVIIFFRLPTNYLGVFDHFVRLALKGLTKLYKSSLSRNCLEWCYLAPYYKIANDYMGQSIQESSK